MSQSYPNLLYHIIFSTKDRKPIIIEDHQVRLYDYIGGIIRGTGGISLGVDGSEDHVHVLAKLRPDRALSDVLRDLKSNATGWMHDRFMNLQSSELDACETGELEACEAGDSVKPGA